MSGKGLDYEIEKIKSYLSRKLKYSEVEFYGRVYKNPTKNDNGKAIPEVYTGAKDYKEVLTNDLNNGIVFLTDSSQHTSVNALEMQTDVSVVFILNLSKIKGDFTRQDSEVQTEVLHHLMALKQFENLSLTIGLDALNEFDTSQIKLSDMQPWHVFSIKGKIKYNINNC